MRDGKTRKLARKSDEGGLVEFQQNYRAKVVVIAGADAGEEHILDRERVTIGRGPSVDLVFDDSAMSRQHAAIEYAGDGFRIWDLGSTNGVFLNGKPIQAGDVAHGDRFEIGGREFQLVIEELEQEPEVFELSSGV